MTDETERKKRNEMARQHQETLGRMAGGIAHDFNNMLTIISGNLELIARTAHGDTERFAERALAAVQRSSQMVSTLMRFARSSSGTISRVNVNDVLSLGLLALIQQSVGSGVEVACSLASNVKTCRTDSVRLESAILNLAINARDAMNGGGSLSISTRNAEIRNTDTHPSGNYIAIEVSDTGYGMTPEIQKRIFEPFFSTKPVERGSGLGLSMVRQFVTEFDGFVTVSSAIGKGSQITLFLPAEPD